jgi:hypothetical protein
MRNICRWVSAQEPRQVTLAHHRVESGLSGQYSVREVRSPRKCTSAGRLLARISMTSQAGASANTSSATHCRTIPGHKGRLRSGVNTFAVGRQRPPNRPGDSAQERPEPVFASSLRLSKDLVSKRTLYRQCVNNLAPTDRFFSVRCSSTGSVIRIERFRESAERDL